jgi:hypothetical protein
MILLVTDIFSKFHHKLCMTLLFFTVVMLMGKITQENIKGRNCEYAIRCDPNAKKGKSFKLWNELMKYKVDYNPDNF